MSISAAILIFGVYSIFIAFIAECKNVQSKIMIKFIPFCGGLMLVLYSLKLLGIL